MEQQSPNLVDYGAALINEIEDLSQMIDKLKVSVGRAIIEDDRRDLKDVQDQIHRQMQRIENMIPFGQGFSDVRVYMQNPMSLEKGTATLQTIVEVATGYRRSDSIREALVIRAKRARHERDTLKS